MIRRSWWRNPFLWALPVALLLGTAAPAWACSDRTTSVFEWHRCWSLSRFLVLGGVVVGLSFLCFVVLFPALLEPHRAGLDKYGRNLARWPGAAFGWTLTACWFCLWAGFLVFFGIISDELRRPPAPGTPVVWLWQYWLMLLTAVVALGGAGIVLFVWKKPPLATAK